MISMCLSLISTRWLRYTFWISRVRYCCTASSPRDAQNVVRHERPVDQRLAGSHEVARVDAQVLAVRHEVLAFDAAFAADDDRSLAAALLAENLDGAVDFGDDRRILRLASFEDFRHARQTAGDVLRARRLRAASWRAAYRP